MEKDYLSSLKSIETENYIDRAFYRPIGYRIASWLSHTSITPNDVTVFSIFVGIWGGVFFYLSGVDLIARQCVIFGIIALILANILDCVDGQLARLTGKKSKIGRILDGFAGDIWFLSIYVFLALTLNKIYDTSLFWFLALASALSHLIQAAVTDYFKTLHLYFIKRGMSSEFENSEEIERKQKEMKSPVQRLFFFFYARYTKMQEILTPSLQEMMRKIKANQHFPLPKDFCLRFRRSNKKIMSLWDFLTFNGRTIPLFIFVLLGPRFYLYYFLYEIIVLNTIMIIGIYRGEKMCKKAIRQV